MIVDDHELIRESWKLLLNDDARFNVVAESHDGHDAIVKAKTVAPDIILMDISMAPMNGFDAAKKILETTPTMGIVGVSANDNPRYATKLLGLGGKGFVTKTSSFEELKTAIVKVHKGEIYICHETRKKSPDIGDIS
jgi:DNA-binding NarL/FixJ family response regulator